MRKLLSLLTVLTLTTPVPLNVIACGNKSTTPPVADETDYLTLAQTAKAKIQTEFANLVDNESNLRVEGDVDNGDKIMTYLKTTDQTVDTKITTTTSNETIEGFLQVLNHQVSDISSKLVSNYPELKPLFNGFNPNEILTVNTNDLDTILTSKAFDWENNDFSILNFKPSDPKYNITNWYSIAANLTLDFKCLDENGKSTTSTINQTYDMYFANDGSNLSNVVSAVTANIKNKIDTTKAVTLEYQKWDDSFVNQKSLVLDDINKYLGKQMNISKLIINTQEIDNPGNNDYNFKSEEGKREQGKGIFPLTLKYSQSDIKNSTIFNSKWQAIIAERENDFATRLNAWKAQYNLTIDNQDNVYVFGEYKTTNWTISGLEIKTISVPYYITTKDISRASNTDSSLEILEKLFVGDNALFQYGKNYDNSKSSNDFNIILNPDIYDDFTTRDVTIQKIYDYLTTQTINFINSSDKLQWVTSDNSYAIKLLNTKISEVKEHKTKYENMWLNINGNTFAMSLGDGYCNFNFSKATTDVWPTS